MYEQIYFFVCVCVYLYIFYRASNDGKTALHVASGLSMPSLVSILVEHGASVKARDELGRTPLHFAAGSTYPSTDIVLYLLKVKIRYIHTIFFKRPHFHFHFYFLKKLARSKC